MPWPTNSRTTENPCASTCSWIAWPMSEIRPPEPHLRDALLERLLRHPQQRRRLVRHAPDRHRDRRVAVEAVQLHAHVERDDVALDQRARRRDPVDHLLVHRRAQRRGIPAIALERRLRARRRAPASRPPRRDRAVVTPGATIAASSARTSATSAFAARIRSSSAGDLQTITARTPRVAPLERRDPVPRPSPPSPTSGGWLPSIDVNVGRAA